MQKYWEILLACLGMSDHTHLSGMNQINTFMYTKPHAKNQLLILAHSWDIVDSLLWITLGIPGHTNLKWLTKFVTPMEPHHKQKITSYLNLLLSRTQLIYDITLGMPDHTQLKWLGKFVAAMDV